MTAMPRTLPKPTAHIQHKERLSQYKQISVMVFHLLSVAQAGGLAEKQAEATFYSIMDAFSTLNGDAFWVFRDELIRILVTPDTFSSSARQKSNKTINRHD